ncbi:hypothetical protein BC829DRAFT_394380, partial [Chytridium lagenaria]
RLPEYEAELDKEVLDLKKRNQLLSKELEELRNRFTAHQTEANKTINSLQNEVEGLRASEKLYKDQTRELEITNSEIEQNFRVQTVTAEDLEAKYNKVLERMIFFEHELEAKSTLEEEAQRLRDELRDAMTELSVVRSKLDDRDQLGGNARALDSPSLTNATIFSETDGPNAMDVSTTKERAVLDDDVEMSAPPKDPPLQHENNIGLTPKSPAIITLNELLQRAKSLEMRITAARDKYVQPLLLSPPMKASSLNSRLSNIGSPNARASKAPASESEFEMY